MARRFFRTFRSLPQRQFARGIVWIGCCAAVLVPAASGEERTPAGPPIRLLYGTRRIDIPVPRQPRTLPAQAADTQEPNSPIWLPPTESVFESPWQPRPPASPTEPPGWDAASALENRPDEEWLAPEMPQAGTETPASAPNLRPSDHQHPEPAIASFAEQERADPDPVNAISEASPPAMAAEPVPTRIDAASPVESSSAHEPSWLRPALTQAAGTVVGMLLGFALCATAFMAALRRQAGRFEPVVRVELLNALKLAPELVAQIRAEQSIAGQNAPMTLTPGCGAADFADADLPLSLFGQTYDERRREEEARRRQMEEAVLRSICDDNLELRKQLAALPRAA